MCTIPLKTRVTSENLPLKRSRSRCRRVGAQLVSQQVCNPMRRVLQGRSPLSQTFALSPLMVLVLSAFPSVLSYLFTLLSICLFGSLLLFMSVKPSPCQSSLALIFGLSSFI